MRLLRSLKLLLIPAILLAGSFHAYAQDDYSELSREVLRRINEYRVKKGLTELTWNETITEAAIEHSKYMGNKTIRINHDGFEERMYGLMKALPGRGAAENVANGQHSAEEVVSMWIASPGHRENIEGDYDLSGVGIYKNRNGVLYFTHIFIKKKKVVATAKKAG